MVHWKSGRVFILKCLLCWCLFAGVLLVSNPINAEQQVTIFKSDVWKHPVKDVLINYGIDVTQVKLVQNKTYPLIYCVFPEYSMLREKESFEGMLKEVLKANGYWSYTLLCNEYRVEVDGDVKSRSCCGIRYKNMERYFKRFPVAENIQISYSKANANLQRALGAKMTSFADIEGIDERNGHIYYQARIYENHPDHITTLAWLYVDAFDGRVYIDPDCSLLNFEGLKKLGDGNSKAGKYKVLDQDTYNPEMTYCWQYNQCTHEIQKVDLIKLKIVANIKLETTYLKGELAGFSEMRNSNTLVAAVCEKGRYVMYKSLTEKDRFRWFLDAGGLKTDSGLINTINYYKENQSYVLSINGGEKSIRFTDDSPKGWTDMGVKTVK